MVRCCGIDCQRFQMVKNMLPWQDDYITCRYCERRQPCRAYVHPVSGFTMRDYNHDRLLEEMRELIKKQSRKPGADMQKSAPKALTNKPVERDRLGGDAGSCHVPDDVQAGDLIEIRAGMRKVRAVVESVA